MHSSIPSNNSSASAARGEGGRQEDRFTVMHGSTFIGYSPATAARYVRGESGRQWARFTATQHFSVRQMPCLVS